MNYNCTADGTFNDQWLIETVFPNKRNGYFIEVGAYDGITESASYCLETELDWKGICVEPIPSLYERMVKIRKTTCLNCVLSNVSGKEDFVESDNLGYSGITRYITGGHKTMCYGVPHRLYQVESITFPDLLQKYNVPKTIDVISMDIEGAEYDCLTLFPFDTYTVSCFILECSDFDYGKLRGFLKSHGYKVVYNPFNRKTPWEKYFMKV